jgi:ABC-type phosphate transport system substrate-binding protein
LGAELKKGGKIVQTTDTTYSKGGKTRTQRTKGTDANGKPTSPGSASGISEFIEGKADFATTETPLTEEQLRAAAQKRGGDVLQIPVVLGAVVPIYRVDGADVELKFPAAVLAGIYLGKVTEWSDPEIRRANPGVSFPDHKIVSSTDRTQATQPGSGPTF